MQPQISKLLSITTQKTQRQAIYSIPTPYYIIRAREKPQLLIFPQIRANISLPTLKNKKNTMKKQKNSLL